jgi:hypothetical protein
MAVLARRLISTLRAPRLPDVESQASVRRIVSELIPVWRASTEKAEWLQTFYDTELERKDRPKTPRSATAEQKALLDESPTPWGKMIVDSMSQHLIYDDIRLKNGGSSPALDLIERNSLGGRQRPVHDGSLIHGKAFNLVLPAQGRLDARRTAAIRGKSALVSDAFYRDEFDEYPDYFLEGEVVVNSDGSREMFWTFVDDSAVHFLSSEIGGAELTYITNEPHGMGVCPVVRFAPNLTLTGRCTSEIEPYVRLFKRINQSTFDRLIVQRYGAFIIRTIAGIAEPKTDAEKRAQAMGLAVTDLLVSPDVKTRFGSLPGTPLDGFIRSREADIRDLAATSQTPSFHMLGLSDNVGAEGLAAAQSAQIRKRDLFRLTLGESWEQSFRLGGVAMGNEDVAADFSSRLHWVLTETMSIQSLAQALGVFATQLGIPPELLWRYVPDWNQQDTEEAKRLLVEIRGQALQDAEMEQQRAIELAQSGAKVKRSGNGQPAAR